MTHKSKAWRYLYRFNGKQNTFTIGTYPNILPKEARLKLSEAKGMVNQGVDPNLQKRQKIQALESRKIIEKQEVESETNIFGVVARQWLSLQENAWVESHAKKLIARLENHIFPYIGQMPISQVEKKPISYFLAFSHL